MPWQSSTIGNAGWITEPDTNIPQGQIYPSKKHLFGLEINLNTETEIFKLTNQTFPICYILQYASN